MVEVKLKTNVSYKRKHYRAGSIVEFKKEELEDSRLSKFVEEGLIVPIEDDGETVESSESVEESEESVRLTIDFVTSIDGIGEAYGRNVVEEYPTVSSLQEASFEEVASNVTGLGESLARDLVNKAEEVDIDNLL